MFPEFTNTKISNNHVTSRLIPFVACHLLMMTLKPPTPLPLCSLKSLKFRNYGKAPYIFSSYCQSPR